MRTRRRVPTGAALAAAVVALAGAGGAAGLAGCGSDEDSGSERFTDLSEPIDVEEGETFEIALDANPTTGYEWRAILSPRESVVTLEGRRYELEEGAEDRVGAGGTEAFTFEAVAAGGARVRFEYVPPGGGQPGEQLETEIAQVTVR